MEIKVCIDQADIPTNSKVEMYNDNCNMFSQMKTTKSPTDRNKTSLIPNKGKQGK